MFVPCSLVVTAAGLLGVSVSDALEAYGLYFVQHVEDQVGAAGAVCYEHTQGGGVSHHSSSSMAEWGRGGGGELPPAAAVALAAGVASCTLCSTWRIRWAYQ
jgi:hypothetical protein